MCVCYCTKHVLSLFFYPTMKEKTSVKAHKLFYSEDIIYYKATHGELLVPPNCRTIVKPI